jgi:hypothetical protein
VFVGSESMHREPLDLKGGPYDLSRAALTLHELGLESLDVLAATKSDAAPPSPATSRGKQQRKPKRRADQAPAREPAPEAAEERQTLNATRVSSRPRSRRR